MLSVRSARPHLSGSSRQGKVFVLDMCSFKVEQGQAARHPEPWLARVTRVEEEGAAHSRGKGLMCMAEDEHVRFLEGNRPTKGFAERVGIHDVVNEETRAVQLEALGESVTLRRVVRVSHDDGGGSDLLQRAHDGVVADITPVKNVVDASE